MQHSIATSLSALTLALALAGTVHVPAFAADDSATELDAREVADLAFMREEEKLARDVYAHLYPLWDAAIFANISESEQQHFDAVGDLLDRYRLDDPARQDIAGVFVNTELQALYDQLTAQGASSELAALHVGALIEESDMEDIAAAIAATDEADIRRVYDNLMRGSRNHLRAFVGAIEDLGVTYTAQVLPQDEVDAIVDSPVERGGRPAKGTR